MSCRDQTQYKKLTEKGFKREELEYVVYSSGDKFAAQHQL